MKKIVGYGVKCYKRNKVDAYGLCRCDKHPMTKHGALEFKKATNHAEIHVFYKDGTSKVLDFY